MKCSREWLFIERQKVKQVPLVTIGAPLESYTGPVMRRVNGNITRKFTPLSRSHTKRDVYICVKSHIYARRLTLVVKLLFKLRRDNTIYFVILRFPGRILREQSLP